MLLKGVGEVEAAPDRRAAAEMVLIRLCHVADMPPPGELVRRLTDGRRRRAAAAAPARRHRRRRRRARGRQWRAGRSAKPAPGRRRAWPASAMSSALVAAQREAMLHAHLLHSVHLVRFAPPVIELRPEPDAPRDLAARLAALLPRRPARAGPSRCPPRRASRHWPSRATPPTRARRERRRRPPAGARDPGGVSRARGSTRCTTRRPTPMGCRPTPAGGSRTCPTSRRPTPN